MEEDKKYNLECHELTDYHYYTKCGVLQGLPALRKAGATRCKINVLIHYFVSAMFDQELSDKSKVQWIDFIVHSNNILFALALES